MKKANNTDIIIVEILYSFVNTERGENMAISYKKLWKLLIDKDLKKKDLAKIADVSTYTISKLNRSENVNTETLAKICKALNCSFDDIMEIVDDNQEEDQDGQ